MTGLDSRLAALYDSVRSGSVAADVGADHGFLICELVASGKCPRGFASDIRTQPLEAAKRHIREQGLSGRVEAVLSDGLSELPGDEIDDVIIAGMGGELIADILTAVPWTRNPAKRFHLQPMTRAEHLRRTLCREGFALLDETAVQSGRFVYSVITAAYTGQRQEPGALFAHTGLLLNKGDEPSRAYLRRVRARITRKADGLEQAIGPPEEIASLRELATQITERIQE